MTTRRATENSKALDAFIAAKAEIDVMLERLKALSDDHFETHPDEIHWGHVGTLKHYAGLLRQITDSGSVPGGGVGGRARSLRRSVSRAAAGDAGGHRRSSETVWVARPETDNGDDDDRRENGADRAG